MNLDEIKKILAIISAVFQTFQVNQLTAKIWSEVLEAKNYEDCERAVFQFLKSDSPYPPTPGMINKIISENKVDIQKPEEVLNIILKCARGGFDYSCVSEQLSKNEIALRCLEFIGYETFRYGNLDSIPFVKKEFLRLYNSMTEDLRNKYQYESITKKHNQIENKFVVLNGQKEKFLEELIRDEHKI